jgi:hypothetical protein
MTVYIGCIHARRFTPFHTHMTVFYSFLTTTVHTGAPAHDGLGGTALVRRFKTRVLNRRTRWCGIAMMIVAVIVAVAAAVVGRVVITVVGVVTTTRPLPHTPCVRAYARCWLTWRRGCMHACVRRRRYRGVARSPTAAACSGDGR